MTHLPKELQAVKEALENLSIKEYHAVGFRMDEAKKALAQLEAYAAKDHIVDASEMVDLLDSEELQEDVAKKGVHGAIWSGKVPISYKSEDVQLICNEIAQAALSVIKEKLK